MSIKKLTKKASIAALTLLSSALMVNANAQDIDQENWIDLSDPSAIYSGVGIAGGTEGIDVSAKYGGYLNGQYKHQIAVEAMNDLEYYNINYKVLNASSLSGFTLESTWDRDFWGMEDVNDSSFGVFAKIPLIENQLYVHPKVNLGVLWGDDVESTTYIKFDATTRYKFNNIFWAGITPTYTYATKGRDINDWQGTLEAGVQLSSAFSLAAHVNDDEEFWADVLFLF